MISISEAHGRRGETRECKVRAFNPNGKLELDTELSNSLYFEVESRSNTHLQSTASFASLPPSARGVKHGVRYITVLLVHIDLATFR